MIKRIKMLLPAVLAVLLLAGCHAAAAQDALVVVAHHMRRGIVDGVALAAADEAHAVDAVVAAELLQLTVGAAHAGQTVLVVGGKQQLQVRLAGRLHFFAVCHDLHAFIDGVHTRGDQAARAFDLHNADTARTDLVDLFQIAQGRNLNAHAVGRFQDSRAGSDFVGHVIDLDMYGFHSLSLPLLTFADGAEFALLDAGAALNTLGGIDGMRLAHGAADGAGRAGARAQRAALALDGVDLVVQQRLAHARRAALVDDVLHIFVAEVAQCGEDGVRGCLAQAAQAVGFDEFGQLCDFVQILHGALAVRDHFKIP